MKTYGYIRVSTKEQNLDRQIDALAAAGITAPYLFEDKQSGKDFDRPAYKALMETVQPGDLIVGYSPLIKVSYCWNQKY